MGGKHFISTQEKSLGTMETNLKLNVAFADRMIDFWCLSKCCVIFVSVLVVSFRELERPITTIFYNFLFLLLWLFIYLTIYLLIYRSINLYLSLSIHSSIHLHKIDSNDDDVI